jgi:tyrosine decarboxylase/aspartate 1-decarboxylase
LWKTGASKEVIGEELASASAEDLHFSDGRIFASMCAQPLDVAAEAHMKFLEANLGNAGLYLGTLRLERQVVGALASMLHGQDAEGSVVSGGTEANITALWVARNITGKKKVIFPRSAHFSFHKACDILGLEPCMIDLTDEFVVDMDEVEKFVDETVCAVVGVAGTTELGTVDDIEGLGRLLPEGAFLHVDAAFGGFVLPFLELLGTEVRTFDFRIPEVSSITIDPHKMGMSTIPAGALLLRHGEQMDVIRKDAPYLDTVGQTTALSGTRCSAAVAATYAAMRFLGEEGYLKLVGECMDVTRHALDQGIELGLEPVIEPLMNIVCFYVPDVYGTQAELEKLGWKVSVARNPESLRLVIMPYVTLESVDRLFADLGKVLGGK